MVQGKSNLTKQDKLIVAAVKNEKERAITKDERDEEIKSIFELFDKNGDGKLENSEIKSFMNAIGRDPSDEEIQKLIEKADSDKNGFITIDEFLVYMDDVYVLQPDQIEDLVDAFKIFDVDKSGTISKKEFENILTKYGANEFSEEDIKDIFNMIDIDKDGTINYAEFIDMWKYQ